MMLLFHVVVLEVCIIVNKLWHAVSQSVPDNVVYSGTSKYNVNGVTFEPPMYIQRQEAVLQILNSISPYLQIKKIIDFGCGRFEYFKHLKSLRWVQEILEIDVNEDLLESEHCRVAATASDFMVRRDVEMSVKVLVGSISELDSCLLGADAVICVEVIEHLYPETLENVPYTVFGFVKPRVAIFTTPNRDHNILFDMQTPFRDADHKFEWSREQFQCWGNNIVERYPDYGVTFHGIGRGPQGSESVGCCSQMAIFIQKVTDLKETPLRDLEGIGAQPIYRLVAEYNYPAYRNLEQEDINVMGEVWSVISEMGLAADEHNSDFRVPLKLLHSNLKSNSPSLSELQNTLENSSWRSREFSGEIYVYPFADLDDESEEEDPILDECVFNLADEHVEVNGWEQSAIEEQWDS